MEFPTLSDAINDVTLSPRLLTAVSQLLRTDEIRLAQSDVWAKDGVHVESPRWLGRRATDSYDQRVHMDYPNHMLVHPPEWERPDSVAAILYYDDASECGGETAFVPRRSGASGDAAYDPPYHRTPGVRGSWINDKEMAEARYRELDPDTHAFRASLYEREIRARYRRGSCLFYRQDLWHRGTPVNAGVTRVVHNLSFRRSSSTWVGHWHPGAAKKNYLLGWPRRRLESLVARLTVPQRAAIGFPPPSSPYWTPQTLRGTQARYASFPHFDWRPYEAAMAARSKAAIAAERGGRGEQERSRL